MTEWLNAFANSLTLLTALVGLVALYKKSADALIVAEETKEKVIETHMLINSRMDELLALARSEAFAKGSMEGTTKEQDRAADVAKMAAEVTEAAREQLKGDR